LIASRDNLHINSPDLMSPGDRARDTLVTAMMWLFYLYLWVPLISLFAWLLGFEFAYDVMVRAGGASELARVLLLYGVIVTVIFCVVTAWSLGNRFRYGSLHRRTERQRVTAEQMAGHFGVDVEFIGELRNNKRSIVTFDADGIPDRR